MAKNPIVDANKCIGCSACMAIAAKTFKMDDNGKSVVVNPTGDDEQTIQLAIDGCPVQAISWQEMEQK